MDILQIVGFGLIATFLSLILKENKSTLAFGIVVFAGTVLFLLMVEGLQNVFSTLERLAVSSHVNLMYLETILKIIRIAYIAEFGAQITRDAEQNAIASKIELGGKIMILTIAIPILSVVLETVLSFLPK